MKQRTINYCILLGIIALFFLQTSYCGKSPRTKKLTKNTSPAILGGIIRDLEKENKRLEKELKERDTCIDHLLQQAETNKTLQTQQRELVQKNAILTTLLSKSPEHNSPKK